MTQPIPEALGPLDPIPTEREIAPLLWDLCNRYDSGDRDAVRRYAAQFAEEFARVAALDLNDGQDLDDGQALDDSRPTALYAIAVALVFLGVGLAIGVGVLDLGLVALGGAVVIVLGGAVVGSVADRFGAWLRATGRADS